MLDENIKNNQGFCFPSCLKSHSNEGAALLSRENSFFDTKFSSKEFQLQYNKSFLTPRVGDSKFTQMILKTNTANLFRKIEELLNSHESQSVLSDESYVFFSDCLCEIGQITDSPPLDKDDYARALSFQDIIVDKMIKHVDLKQRLEE